MIKKDDIIEVEIEKLVYPNTAVARFGEEKFVIFVKNALKGEILKVKIVSLNKKYARGEIIEIIKPSKHRIKPFCALYNACGSCSAQICDYDFSVEEKTEILKDIFYNIDKNKILPTIKSPKIKEYRCKIQYPARRTKNSKRMLLGYFRENSHNLTNIKFCPLNPPVINDLAQFIRDEFILDCYSEKTKKGLLKNILIRINSENKEILLTFILNCKNRNFSKFEYDFLDFCKKITEKFSEIKGIFVNFNDKNVNRILGDETKKIFGDDYIVEILEDKKFKIGAVSFFQVNPYCAKELFKVVENNIKENSAILDAYGGVGAIGIFVSQKAKKITLVEENENAVLMAQENFKLNKIENYEILKGDAKKHFARLQKEKTKFDCIILDPPRSGCEKEGLEAILELARDIIYVSCNPKTLKRDMEIILEHGFDLKFIQGVDLFPHTYHIESVAVFNKRGKFD